MTRLLNRLEAMTEWTGKLVSYLVWIGAVMLSWEVVARYFFSAPTVWAHGYSQRIFGSYFVLVGGYTLLRGGHVRVDLLTSRLSLRVQKFFDLVNYGFLLLWSGVLIGEGWLFFFDSWKIREVDEMVLAHPVYPYKFLLVIGGLMIFVQGIGCTIRTLGTMKKE